MTERRVVIQHEDGMAQIVSLWPAGRPVPPEHVVHDELGRLRLVTLVAAREHYIRYRMEPPAGAEVAAPTV